MLGKILEKKSASGSQASGGSAVGDSVTNLAAGDFESFVQRRDCVVVIDFHADWCGPCKRLGPILEKVAADSGGTVQLGKVDVDQAGDLPRKLGVSGIPDVRIFRDGKQVDRFVGLIPEAAVRQKIQPHTAGLSPKAAAPSDTPPPPAGSTAAPGELPPAKNSDLDPSSKDWLPAGMQRR